MLFTLYAVSLVIACSLNWPNLPRIEASLITFVRTVFQRDFAIQAVTQVLQLLFNAVNVKPFGEWLQRNCGSTHFEQNAAPVRSDLLVGFHLINRQAIVRQSRRDLVHETRVVRSFQSKVAGICPTIVTVDNRVG